MKYPSVESIKDVLPPIRCAVCDRHIANVSIEVQEYRCAVVVTVACHGETEQMDLDKRFYVEMGGNDGPEGLAFVRQELPEMKRIAEASL